MMLTTYQDTVKLSGLPARRRDLDRAYLKSLTNENLLRPFYQEAGINALTYLPKSIHGGWDSPYSQIRGTVCGHWLSAAAMIYQECGDLELKIKGDEIVSQIALCQEENGGEWCFPIPEKYLYRLKQGKPIWAPHYVCHKVMMGLLDMYRYAGNAQALSVVEKAAEWFLRYSQDIDPDTMARMMNEETGGLMEFWADLYSITNNPDHLTLMRRYERRDLYESLLGGENPLSNMHANGTIPEMHGAARAYEVTGEERYRQVVERYWQIAVEECLPFVTGGQTSGEMWTPPGRHSARIGKLNQEHCTVYNMMRLAGYLFRWTGESKYADFWEKNFYNGILAQGFHEESAQVQICEAPYPEMAKYVSYFLPLEAGAKKAWGSATDDFWCCHCTLLQANAFLHQNLYFHQKNTLYIPQYLDAEVRFDIEEIKGSLVQHESRENSHTFRIAHDNMRTPARPDYLKRVFEVSASGEKSFSLAFRRPDWCAGEMEFYIDGEKTEAVWDQKGFAHITRNWNREQIMVIIPKKITFYPLADDPNTGAFLDGPVALAALTEEERTLYYHNSPEEILIPRDERWWCSWRGEWKTTGQPVNLKFLPLYAIGDEVYTTYFPVKQRKEKE